MTEQPVACSLNAADQQSRFRVATALAARALIGADEISGGMRFRFSAGAETQRDLAELIEAESECCPFLGFDLQREGRLLVLVIRGPDEAQSLIKGLFGLRPSAVAE